MVLQLPMMKLEIFFTLFSLLTSCIHSKNMLNQMEINCHIFTLSVTQYIHLLDCINHVIMQSNIIIIIVNVSINTVYIPNIYVNVRTWKIQLPQGNFLPSLTQPKITRQRPFKITDIEYGLINYLVTKMECAEYKTSVGRNIINVDYMEDFAIFQCYNVKYFKEDVNKP